MSIPYEAVKDFWDYVEFYPGEGEPGFDGVHTDGIKGLTKDAPESARKAYAAYMRMEQEAKRAGIRL